MRSELASTNCSTHARATASRSVSVKLGRGEARDRPGSAGSRTRSRSSRSRASRARRRAPRAGTRSGARSSGSPSSGSRSRTDARTCSRPAPARGGGPTLMFNGHLDTSYSGREPWLAGIPGFQPEGFVRDGRIYGLGISNMKGAFVAYLAAVRALGDAELQGRRDARGGRWRDREDAAGRRAGGGVPRLRGRLTAPRRARRRRGHVHPRRADRAEARARALRDALAAALDVRAVRPHGLLVRAARGELDRAHARRARPGARVAAGVGGGDVIRRRARGRERRRDPGRLRLARLADAASNRPVRRSPRAAGRRDGGGAAAGAGVRARAGGRRGGGLRDRAGRRARRVASVGRRAREAHEEVFGACPSAT